MTNNKTTLTDLLNSRDVIIKRHAKGIQKQLEKAEYDEEIEEETEKQINCKDYKNCPLN